MTTIQIYQPEVGSDQRTKAERFDAYLEERMTELMARKEISFFQPFFESKKITNALRRLQTACDWRKWAVFYETWGCLVCGHREEPHGALGMCRPCHRRTSHRLKTILQRLNKDGERADDIIENERRAYKAFCEAVPSLVSELKALPAAPVPAEQLAPKRRGRPHLKPQMSPEEAGPRMRKLRKLAGLSHERLAKAAGVTEVTIINFEKGRRQMLPGNCAAAKRVLVEALVNAYWPE